MLWTAESHYSDVVGILLASSVLVFLVLSFIDAPYGRFVRSGWGPVVPSRFGWIAMELPAPASFIIVYMAGDHAGQALPIFFMLLFQVHYLHRTFIFPLLMRGNAKKSSASTVALAIVFNVLNGSLCAVAVSQYHSYEAAWVADPRFIIGVVLFLAGFGINLHSDAILRNLRAPGESGYRIPFGGLYRWVSSPNYLGEIVEWTGWAVMTWSGAGLAFALFTAANLIPRARANQRWYQEQFDRYPSDRKALIPGLW